VWGESESLKAQSKARGSHERENAKSDKLAKDQELAAILPTHLQGLQSVVVGRLVQFSRGFPG
jgi:hypothetical protein